MREPNLDDPRLTLRTALGAKRKLYAISKKLGVSMDRVIQQLISDTPDDLRLSDTSAIREDEPAYGDSLAKAAEKAQAASERLEGSGRSKLKKAKQAISKKRAPRGE